MSEPTVREALEFFMGWFTLASSDFEGRYPEVLELQRKATRRDCEDSYRDLFFAEAVKRGTLALAKNTDSPPPMGEGK